MMLRRGQPSLAMALIALLTPFGRRAFLLPPGRYGTRARESIPQFLNSSGQFWISEGISVPRSKRKPG